MRRVKLAYKTIYGRCYLSSIEDFIDSSIYSSLKGKVSLILTSPPFPLNRKKKYGNLNGNDYLNWLSGITNKLRVLLKRNGSFVLELGNSWQPGKPVMSTLSLKALLSVQESGNYYLCQNFIWYNNAKLPTPAQWVNIERIRVKDSFTNLWWLSKSSRPKANNRNILNNYSDSMNKLLVSKKYNSGLRPSEHVIGEKTFLNNNNGSIPSNVLIGTNTHAFSKYINYCKRHEIKLHPARMPIFIPEFFIKFLTKPGDLVFDPFAGSNTTAEAAENLKRKWISVEQNADYVLGSKGRFLEDETNE